MRRPAGKLEEVAVGDIFGRLEDRDLVLTAGCEVSLEEVGADVVAVRQLQAPHLSDECRFGPRWEAATRLQKDWEEGVEGVAWEA